MHGCEGNLQVDQLIESIYFDIRLSSHAMINMSIALLIYQKIIVFLGYIKLMYLTNS